MRVSEAKSQAQIALVACIRNAADHNWRAAAWSLERRDSANWSLRQQLAVHATGHEPMKVIVEYVDHAAPASLLTSITHG